MPNFKNQCFQQFIQPLTPADNLSSFIYTNALLRSANELKYPLLHFWTLEDTVYQLPLLRLRTVVFIISCVIQGD